jgi:dipeptidyl aminopeptidase/acylaminoacyl peptidase
MAKLSNIPNIINHRVVLFKKGIVPDKVCDAVKKNPGLEVISMQYRSDKLSIHGFIFRKKGVTKKLPVVIFCRGGNNLHKNGKMDMLPGFFYMQRPLVKLVNEGKCIVFSSNYRGSVLSEGDDEFGGADVNDIINLYPIIKKYKYSDHKNVALYGWSRGVTMALLVHKQVSWVKCLILGAGQVYYENTTFRPGMTKMFKEGFKLTDKDLRARGAIHWADKLPKKAPILIMHGSADWRVSIENAYLLGLELQKNTIPYKMVLYPGGSHGLMEYADGVCLEIYNWVCSYLLSNKQDGIDLKPHGK